MAVLKDVTYCEGRYEDADALVIATEWEQFRALYQRTACVRPETDRLFPVFFQA